MEIKNTTLMEEKLFFAFQNFNSRFFKKIRKVNLIFEILFYTVMSFGILMSVLVAILILSSRSSESMSLPIMFFFLVLFISALRVYQKLFLPKMLYNNSSLKNSSYNYTFKDDEFSTEAKSDTITSNDILKYSSLFKVYETEGEMFLYINPGQAMLVSKYGFASESDLAAVRERLSALLGKKYIIVK